MGLFDDLPDVFTDPDTGFGEPVKYVSSETGKKIAINGIWTDRPIMQGLLPGADAPAVTVDVRTADVPNPLEGDEVTRVATKVTMKVVSPIQPDNYGMTKLTLEKIDA